LGLGLRALALSSEDAEWSFFHYAVILADYYLLTEWRLRYRLLWSRRPSAEVEAPQPGRAADGDRPVFVSTDFAAACHGERLNALEAERIISFA
jgi:hypothetical protein